MIVKELLEIKAQGVSIRCVICGYVVQSGERHLCERDDKGNTTCATSRVDGGLMIPGTALFSKFS